MQSVLELRVLKQYGGDDERLDTGVMLGGEAL
jgi:hypothetical protein